MSKEELELENEKLKKEVELLKEQVRVLITVIGNNQNKPLVPHSPYTPHPPVQPWENPVNPNKRINNRNFPVGQMSLSLIHRISSSPLCCQKKPNTPFMHL